MTDTLTLAERLEILEKNKGVYFDNRMWDVDLKDIRERLDAGEVVCCRESTEKQMERTSWHDGRLYYSYKVPEHPQLVMGKVGWVYSGFRLIGAYDVRRVRFFVGSKCYVDTESNGDDELVLNPVGAILPLGHTQLQARVDVLMEKLPTFAPCLVWDVLYYGETEDQHRAVYQGPTKVPGYNLLIVWGYDYGSREYSRTLDIPVPETDGDDD